MAAVDMTESRSFYIAGPAAACCCCPHQLTRIYSTHFCLRRRFSHKQYWYNLLYPSLFAQILRKLLNKCRELHICDQETSFSPRKKIRIYLSIWVWNQKFVKKKLFCFKRFSFLASICLIWDISCPSILSQICSFRGCSNYKISSIASNFCLKPPLLGAFFDILYRGEVAVLHKSLSLASTFSSFSSCLQHVAWEKLLSSRGFAFYPSKQYIPWLKTQLDGGPYFLIKKIQCRGGRRVGWPLGCWPGRTHEIKIRWIPGEIKGQQPWQMLCAKMACPLRAYTAGWLRNGLSDKLVLNAPLQPK
jgi:hypothetical protein